MRAPLLITMLLFVQLANYPLQGQNPYIKNFTINDGLPSNNVYNVFKDSRKFIWFATDAGVVRFDGTNFKTYTTADGLPNSEIMRIEEDSRGRLWLFHLNGKFSYIYKDRLFTARDEAFLDSLSNSKYFRRMYEDEEGSLYFYSNLYREIFVLDHDHTVSKYQLPSKNIFCRRINGPRQANIICKIDRSNGSYILYLQDGILKSESLNEIPEQHETTYSCNRAFTQKNNVFFIDANNKHQNNHILLKYNGLNLVDSISFSYRRPDEIITHAFEDMNGNVWISSYFTGVYVYRNRMLIRHFNIEKAQNILEDHEGNIWIASLGNGAYRFHHSILDHEHLLTEQFSDKGIKAMSAGKDGSLLLTDGSYLYLMRHDKLLRSSEEISNNGINQIEFLENGLVVWNEPDHAMKVVTLSDFTSKEFTVRQKAVLANKTKQFSTSPQKKSFAAFYPSCLYQIHQDKPGLFHETNHNERFTKVFYNPAGQLFASGRVIYSVEDDSLTPYLPLNHLSGKIIRQHLILDSKTQLFNISGDSLWLFHSDSLFSLIRHFDQKIPSQIKTICYNTEAGLFMASSSHVYRASDPFRALQGLPVEISKIDVRFNNINQITFLNGKLVVASEDGLSQIPLQAATELQSAKVIPYFSQKLLNGNPIPYGKDSCIVSGSHSFSVTLSSIHFGMEKATYAYKLEGRDTAWTQQQNSNIVYQDLRPGKYTFKFKARINHGEWSDELQHHIQVKPTLNQHPLFYLSLTVIILASLFVMYIRRKNKMLREQETAHQMLILEQKALNSMMNPHFIFNTLGSIQSYILKNNPSDAGLYLSQFARLIRQNLNAIKTSMIPIEEEVQRLINYLDLERLRLNNRFSFTVDMDVSIEEDALIPTMIIQPIVENAIWHGISSLQTGGLISISFVQLGETRLEISIEDNGIGRKKASELSLRKESHLNIGMSLTKRRLELIEKKTGIQTLISTTDAQPGNENPGTRVVIIVPVSYNRYGE